MWRQMQVTGALARHWNAVDVQGADDALPGRRQTSRSPWAGRRSVAAYAPRALRRPRHGCRAVKDSTLVAWYSSFYAPRTGGAYDSHHWTAGIACRTRRRGSRVAA